MSRLDSSTNGLRPRIAGKWQIPLLVVSTVLLARAVYSFRKPSAAELPLSESRRILAELVEGGARARALELAEKLMARADATEEDRAAIRLQRARLRSGLLTGDRSRATAAVGRLVDDYRFAREHGQCLSGVDLRALGRGLEEQEKFSEAVEAYGAALAAGVESPFDLRRRVIDLQRTRLGSTAEDTRRSLLEFVTELPEDRLDLRNWALLGLLGVLEELGRLPEASELLESNRERFAGSDYVHRFDYLEALLLFKQGARDECERRLRALRNRVERSDEVDAMAGWLLGRAVLSDDGPQRPQEAAAFFRDVISRHGRGAYVTASRIGLSEALAQLERHDDAVASCRQALEELENGEFPSELDREVLGVSLGVTADSLHRAGQLEAALEYLPLAAKLADASDSQRSILIRRQIAQLHKLIAEQLDRKARGTGADGVASPSEERHSETLYAEAAEAFQHLALVQKSEENAFAEANWQAAELFVSARQPRRALTILDTLRAERANHPFAPRILLRLGQLRQQVGELRGAIDAYQECYRRFPRTLEAARALVPLAQCYFLLEPNHIELVERTLRIVLEESEVFTPAAPEFADAVFLLGDALWRQGDSERAIPILREALERYPGDERAVRARFLLADCFRRSALALKRGADVDAAGPWEEDLREEYSERFADARQGFRDVIEILEDRPRPAKDSLNALLLRHAYLYEADCRFEVQDYRGALQAYDVAIGLFRDQASSLGASVQVVHCHVFLGEPQEARIALARAMVLVDAMPPAAFEGTLHAESREDWKRYLGWLDASGLF